MAAHLVVYSYILYISLQNLDCSVVKKEKFNYVLIAHSHEIIHMEPRAFKFQEKTQIHNKGIIKVVHMIHALR